MPVQIHNQIPVPRPLGRVEPSPDIGGSVELRLHGVGGTPPEELLGDLAPQLVAGDRIAGFYRSAKQPRQRRDSQNSEGRHHVGEDRHIEGYSWGGLTSRSASRALWVLMLPFALANVSGWMCRPNVLASKPLFYLHRFVARLAALAMTLNVVMLLLMAGEDLIGAQCASYGTCRGDFAPASLLYRFTDHHLGRSMAIGALLPVVILALFELLSRVTANRYEFMAAPSSPDQENSGTAARPRRGLADPDFWHGYQAARRLSLLHLAGGLALVAGVLEWTTHRTLVGGDLSRWNAVVLGASGLTLALVVLSLWLDTTNPWWTRFMTTISLVVVAAAIVHAWQISTTVDPHAPANTIVHGMRDAANGTFGFVGATIVLSAVVGLLGWLHRKVSKRPPTPQRRVKNFLFGPVVALAFAFSLINAVGSLVIVRIGAWIGFPEVDQVDITANRDRYMYSYIASVGTWAFTVAVLVIVAFAAVALFRWWVRGLDDHTAILDDYPTAPVDDTAWVRVPDRNEPNKKDLAWLAGIARARFLAKLPRSLDWLLVSISVAAGVTFAVVDYRYLHLRAPIQPVSWLATLTSFLAALAPLGLIALMRSSLKSGSVRRHVGIAWDVATFWPRAYHPFAPPCYAERAVPDLQWRLWYLQAHGSDVTIAAHSQGTVIAAAALLQQESRLPGSTLRLLTFGSPLDTLYRWAFPAYFSDEVLQKIVTVGPATVPTWLNFYYQTDYIGNTLIVGSDNHQLPDPPTSAYIEGQARQMVGSHSGYWTDPAVWTEVEGEPPLEVAEVRVALPQPPPSYLPTQRAADASVAIPRPAEM